MPRPPDNYTHSQFEPANPDPADETVICKHCRNWTTNVKVLNRKKEHLLRCTQYLQWRAEGNGQDLPPPNRYQRRETGNGSRLWDDEESFHSDSGAEASSTIRGPNMDIGKYFTEFWDDSSAVKSLRARCNFCGLVRQRNYTRQAEHLASCKLFLDSPQAQEGLGKGEFEVVHFTKPMRVTASQDDVFTGRIPNQSLQMGNGAHLSMGAGPLNTPRGVTVGPPQRTQMLPPPKIVPSLAQHLLNKMPVKVTTATQQPFLSHAGCGTLSSSALSTWLGQIGHLSRAMVSFVGSLIGKMRLPETNDSRQHTLYRTMDLLISAVANLRKELDFLEQTKRKYSLEPEDEVISPLTKAYVDLLSSAADPRTSLLEGMVVLWITEHLYCVSWRYASNFTHTMPASNYSIPSYLSASHNPWSSSYPAETPHASMEAQISALRDALIPNWSSRDFAKFVDACKAIVDELANGQTTGSGREELARCEAQFAQVLFLWQGLWPEVDGMGQTNAHVDNSCAPPPPPAREPGPPRVQSDAGGGAGGASGAASAGAVVGAAGPANLSQRNLAEAALEKAQTAVELIDSEPESTGGDSDTPMEVVDSPYGNTGLGAVAAANAMS